MLKSAAALTAAKKRVGANLASALGETHQYWEEPCSSQHQANCVGRVRSNAANHGGINYDLSNGSTDLPDCLMASTSLLPPPHEPDPRSFPSPGRMAITL